MSIDLPHHQILYVSHLAAGCGRDTFASICHVSRRRNSDLAMRGALLFDGARFGQLLQGPSRNVKALMTRIAIDPRHERLVLLFDDPIDPAAMAPSWRFADCQAQAIELLEAAESQRGEPAVSVFRHLLAGAAQWP